MGVIKGGTLVARYGRNVKILCTPPSVIGLSSIETAVPRALVLPISILNLLYSPELTIS